MKKLVLFATLFTSFFSAYADSRVNTCYTLFTANSSVPTKKGSLCLYSWMPELGSTAGGTLVAYVSVDSRSVVYCKKASQLKLKPEGVFITTPDTTIVMQNNTSDSGVLKLGQSKYLFQNARTDMSQLYRIMQSSPLCNLN